jgi:putative mRNA 3-end processing factor
MAGDMVVVRREGLYCVPGGFYIDPWRPVDRGFVLSDQADWPGLMSAIRATGAERVVVTHGSIPIMVRWLCQNGYDAKGFDTEYGDDEAEDAATAEVGSNSAAEGVAPPEPDPVAQRWAVKDDAEAARAAGTADRQRQEQEQEQEQERPDA